MQMCICISTYLSWCVCVRALGLPPSRIYFHFVFRVEMHHSHMRTTGDQTKGFSYRFFFSIFSLVSLYTSRRIAFAFYARTDSKLHIERPLHVFGSVFRIRGDDVRILFIFMYIDKNWNSSYRHNRNVLRLCGPNGHSARVRTVRAKRLYAARC